MRIHISCKIGAVRPTFQRARARAWARSKMETHIHFHGKTFKNISVEGKRAMQHAHQTKFSLDQNFRDRPALPLIRLFSVP